MRVTTTFGSLILGAGLCAARACAPHPRPTTTSSFSSEIGTTTAGGAATTTTSQETLSITDSASSIESSVTVETSTADSATTELETTTSGLTSQETLSVTESQTTVESSAATELDTTTSSLTSQESSTVAESQTTVTSQETETSTTTDEATSTTIEATTTTAGPPVITNLAVNGGFEDETIDPWVVEGASPAVYRSQFWCAEGSKCLQLPGNFANSAKVCQSVAVEAGFEYTLKAQVLQNCIKEYGSNTLVCDDNINTTELSIDEVYDSGNHGIVGYNTYNDFSYTFSYTGPSIDSTDLCITITQNQGLGPVFYLDGVSFTRGQAVPIPDPTE
ncbi:hypothetical protein FPRO05_02298 [Fusarium proliferatum]|uniref:CBM-cenC domain-containing protein n=1 Tax=Gibberella intermedia TaxID=948311 RepID=A0A365MYD8_GIBIN|nr:hypothetical protein FPRO05_02298 [Fusarium proliferatum]